MLDVCIAAVRAGSRVAAKAQNDWIGKSVQKEDKSPVTVADFAVQVVVSHHLFQHFPDVKLLAEENAATYLQLCKEEREECLSRVRDEIPTMTLQEIELVLSRGDFENTPSNTTDSCFVLDPIDGTKGFIRGEQYAICLGFLPPDGIPTIGVLGCPNLWGDHDDCKGYLFEAVLGGGGTRIHKLFLDKGEADSVLLTIARPVSNQIVFTESYEKSHTVSSLHQRLLARFQQEELTSTVIKVIQMDSQVKYALLARGDATVYPRITPFEQCIWDVLPGWVILKEAGGNITDEFGHELVFKWGRTIPNKTLISSCSVDDTLHKRILAFL